MIDVQDRVLSRAGEIARPQEATGEPPTLIRNSRILVAFSFLGSAAAFCISLSMAYLSCSSLFPLHSMSLDTVATAGLWAIGAWIMAVAYVFLWRQGRVMSNCSALLDKFGVHFRLDGTKDSREVFLPWNEIEEVRHKRNPKAEKFTILAADTRIVTFTSYSFYRPRKVARTIAARAGLRVQRG